MDKHMQNFGEGAAVFIAGKLAWFGDAGAARHFARTTVGDGHAKRGDVTIKSVRI